MEQSQPQYAMYLRKSRADLELEALGEEETLARHKKMLFTLAAKHDIHPDQITIYHEMVSGDSIDERPEMQRLIQDVYAKKYKGVLVVEVERLARGNTKDQGEVADAFQYSSTHIITPLKTYNPDIETDQEYFEFGLFMSRREFKTIKRRLITGKNESAEEGNYLLQQRTFGYDIVRKSKKDRYLVIREDEAKIVQLIFDWFTEERKTTGWIARELTKMGIRTVTNRPEWAKQTIYDMLKNVTYIGMIEWGATKTIKTLDPVTGKVVKKRVKSKPEEVKVYKGKHKAIITEEQFKKAQSLLNKTDQAPVRIGETVVNPLAGLLKCSKCGRTMNWFNVPTRAKRYTHRGGTLCNIKSMAVDDVLNALVDVLKAYIVDYEIKSQTNDNKKELLRHSETLTALEAELKKQEARKNRLFDSYEDGAYTREEFIERKQVYATQIETLKSRIQEHQKSAPVPIDYTEKITTLHNMIEWIKSDDLDGKEKNDLLKQYIEIIKYDVIDLGRGKGGKAILDVHLK